MYCTVMGSVDRDSDSNDSNDSKGWCDEVENMLEEWCEEALGRIYIHGRACDSFIFWHWVIFILSTICIGVGGVGTLVVSTINGYKWLGFIFGAMTLVGGIVWAFDDQMLNTSEAATKHEEAQNKWRLIPKKIQVQLQKHIDHRIAADNFIMEVEKDFVEIQSTSPHVSGRYIKKWQELREKYIQMDRRLSNAQVPMDRRHSAMPVFAKSQSMVHSNVFNIGAHHMPTTVNTAHKEHHRRQKQNRDHQSANTHRNQTDRNTVDAEKVHHPRGHQQSKHHDANHSHHDANHGNHDANHGHHDANHSRHDANRDRKGKSTDHNISNGDHNSEDSSENDDRSVDRVVNINTNGKDAKRKARSYREHFLNREIIEKVHTPISDTHPLQYKFNIELNHIKAKELKRLGAKLPQYRIESPYHENLILDPEEFLRRRYQISQV